MDEKSIKTCSHGDPDDTKCADEQTTLEKGKSSKVIAVQEDKSFKVVPNADKSATSAFMDEKPIKTCSHGDPDDTKCTDEQTTLEKGKYSKVVAVQEDKYFKAVPNADKSTTSALMDEKHRETCSHGDPGVTKCADEQTTLKKR